MKRWLVWLLVAVVLGAAAGAAVAVWYARQTLQPVPAVGIMTLCAQPYPNVANVPVGSTGYVFFECQGSPRGAFVYEGGTITPTFTLTAPYTTLFVITESTAIDTGNPTCEDSFFAHNYPMASGQALGGPLNIGSYYGYCADFSNVTTAGLPAVTVSWAAT